jgi:hypothetical protein
VVRSGSDWYTFQNGVQVATATNSGAIWESGADMEIGRGQGGGYGFVGYIDELRFIKGEAVWTSNFTPLESEHGSGSAVYWGQ